jgi:hypothetical protein
MSSIQLHLDFNEDLGLTSVVFMHNSTGINSDSALLEKVSIALLKSIIANKDSLPVQDLLNELGIETKE